jgi:hypothetical protein
MQLNQMLDPSAAVMARSTGTSLWSRRTCARREAEPESHERLGFHARRSAGGS